MKKFILLLAALFTLALSTTAFAASTDNGAALNKEEAAATQLVNALLQNGSLSAVDGLFHPEFKKNINDTNFKALQKEQVKDIAAILLKNLGSRLERQVKLHLIYSDEALQALADEGFNPQFGARPLRRLIVHTVETALSKAIVSGEVREGDTVSIGYDGSHLTFIPCRPHESETK